MVFVLAYIFKYIVSCLVSKLYEYIDRYCNALRSLDWDFFNSICYAYQCVSPEYIYTETDIVKGRGAIFSANEKRVWFYSHPHASCKQKEIFIVKGDLVYVFPSIMVFLCRVRISERKASVWMD